MDCCGNLLPDDSPNECRGGFKSIILANCDDFSPEEQNIFDNAKPQTEDGKMMADFAQQQRNEQQTIVTYTFDGTVRRTVPSLNEIALKVAIEKEYFEKAAEIRDDIIDYQVKTLLK